jgi:hypothetical protein
MNSNDFLAIKKQLPELRKQLVTSPHGRIPKSVEHLESMIANAASVDDKAALYPLVLSECVRYGNHELHVRFLRQQVRDLHDDPLSLTSLATALAQDHSARGEAIRLVAQAVTIAKSEDRQVKYSLTCQARLALEVGDYDLFNDSLRDLIQDAKNHRAEDHGLEFDFLDRADSDKIDKKLVTQYRALAA